MRASALILLVAIGMLLGTAHRAAAEKVRTNQTTKLHAGPGEQKKVLLEVKSGQNMKLLAQEGRWLKVRVRGRTGWVPRSKVDMADDGAIARNTRRRPFVDGRSKRRGFGGASGPDDRIGADAVGEGLDEDDEEDRAPRRAASRSRADDDEEDEAPRRASTKSRKPVDDEEDDESSDDELDDDEDILDEDDEEARPTARVAKRVAVFEEADEESEEKFIASPTDVLYPVEVKGKWTAVENDEGDFGWVLTEYLEMEGAGGPKKRTIAVGARVGTMIIQQAMRTAGSNNLKVPDNYNIGTSSLTVSLGGTFLMPFKAKYLLGVQATYDYSNTVFGGITYDPPDDNGMVTPPVTIGLSIHNINVRALAGYDFKKASGMALFGRLGFRYHGFMVANYNDPMKNPARIPQDVIKGPTLGAAFAMPRLTDKLGLEVGLDTMLIAGSITQTPGLEDGSAPTLKAVTFGTAVTYKLNKTFDLAANYELQYAGIDFGPPLASSMRGHMGNNVRRTDIFHMVTIGVAKPF